MPDGFLVGGIEPGLDQCGLARLYVPRDYREAVRVLDTETVTTPRAWDRVTRVLAVTDRLLPWLERVQAVGVHCTGRFDGGVLVTGAVIRMDWSRRPELVELAQIREALGVDPGAPAGMLWTMAAALVDGFPWGADTYGRNAILPALVTMLRTRAVLCAELSINVRA